MEELGISKYRGFFCYICLVLSQVNWSHAQPSNPHVLHIAHEDYNTFPGQQFGKQNYQCIQDNHGILYVANYEGILTFDGTSWGYIEGANSLSKCILGKSESGIVYVASGTDIGYIRGESSSKALSYHALRLSLSEDSLGQSPFRWVFTYQSHIYFVNSYAIVAFDEQSGDINTYRIPFTSIKTAAGKNGKLFLLSGSDQVYVFSQKSFSKIAANGQIPFPQTGVHLLPLEDNTVMEERLFVIGKKGIYSLENGVWKKAQGEFNTILERNELEINDVALLHDRNIAIATGTSGCYLLDETLKVKEHIYTGRGGLNSNAVHGLYQDKEAGVWIAHNEGLSRLSYPPVLEQFSADFDLDKLVLSVKKWRGQLYVGTLGSELFVIPYAQNVMTKAKITSVPFPEKVYDIWDMMVVGGSLLIATSRGLFVMDNPGEVPQRLSPLSTVYKLHHSPSNPNRVYVAWQTRNTLTVEYYLGILTHQKGSFAKNFKFAQLPHETRDIQESKPGEVWMSSEAVSRVNFDPQTLALNAVTHIELSEEEKEKFDAIEVFTYQNRLYFGPMNGTLSYDSLGNTFVQDSSFGHAFYTGEWSAYGAVEDEQGGLWVSAVSKHMYLPPGPSQRSNWQLKPFRPVPYIWSFYPEDDEHVWFATEAGLYHYRPQVPKTYDMPFNALIGEVNISYEAVKTFEGEREEGVAPRPPEIIKKDSVIFAGTYGQGEEGYQIKAPSRFEQALPYAFKDIHFRFGATTFECPEKTLFSYQLEGYYPYWSAWEAEHELSLPYLEEGKYTLHVKAKNVYGIESTIASYPFRILPPWYRSWWAYGLYVLTIIGVGFIAYRLWANKQQLETQARALVQEREAQVRLKAIDKLKDQFLANTSHELRTPLHGIIGIAESLQDGAAGDLTQAMQKNMEMIISSGKRLSSLVNDLLDFSKIKNRDLALRQKPSGLYPIVEVVIQACQVLVQGKDLTLQNAVPASLPLLWVDENRIQQVLYNLIGNAIKFTEVGKVEVGAQVEGEMVIVSVSDTGTGIPEDKQGAIFNEFEQLDGAADRKFAGTGLGLSISKRLIELHKGTMWLDSALGKGSTFYFSLPIAGDQPSPLSLDQPDVSPSPLKIEEVNVRTTAPVQAPAPQALPNNGILHGKAIRILIVDDEPINHQVLRNILSVRNNELTSAMNGEEALNILREYPNFDLVLLDVMMPRMSGYEVCRRIREIYLPSELPVLMVTAKDQVFDKVAGLESGANDYLSKPFSKDEFLARLKTHLNLHKINTATGKFVPSAFIRALGHELITDVRLGDHAEKEVTVFFSDIRSYTSLAETMTPEENFHFVNTYSQRMGPAIEENHGFVNQYLGDGIMALFLQGPEDALKASIGMQKRIQVFNDEQAKFGRKRIQVGMGFHTGSLIMGIIGDEKRNDAATISDTVNSAARLEGLTKYYGASILCSGQSLQGIPHAKEKYNYRYLGKVQVKGKKEPMAIYEFIDGDREEVKAPKLATLEQFEKGLDAYFQKEFKQAEAALQAVLAANPADIAVQRLLAKIRDNINNGVPQNWNGIETMDSK